MCMKKTCRMVATKTTTQALVSCPGNNFRYYHGCRDPFPGDIEQFRARSEALRCQTAAERSVKNHELFEGLSPEFS